MGCWGGAWELEQGCWGTGTGARELGHRGQGEPGDSSLPELDSLLNMRSVLEIHPRSYILLPSQIKLCSIIQAT